MIGGNPVKQAVIRPEGSPPIAGNFRVTQNFGGTTELREPALSWAGGEGVPAGSYPHFHRGNDLGDLRCGAAVIAWNAGTVRFAGKASSSTLIYVLIDHGDGFSTAYLHLADEVVSAGQKVTKGQLLGHVGSTGNSSACHLHFGGKRNVDWSKNWFTDGNGAWLDMWRRLEQNTSVDPDAPQEADVPTPSTYIPGFVAAIGAATQDVNVRAGSSTTARIIRQIPKATTETWTVTCWEQGETVAGSNQWLVRWNGAWEYVHSSTVLSGPNPPTVDCAPLVKEAHDKGYAEAKKNAGLAVAAI